jgi:hypothetical protein
MAATMSLVSGTNLPLPSPTGWIGHLEGIPILPPDGTGGPPGLTIEISAQPGTPLFSFLDGAATSGKPLGQGSIAVAGSSGSPSLTIAFADGVVTLSTGTTQQFISTQQFILTLWPKPLS